MSTRSAHDDKNLLQALRTGSTLALEEIILKHQRELLYFASHLVKNSAAIEEIVNDAFLKAWNQRNTFNALKELRSFLFVVVRNACLDYLKSPKNKVLDLVDEEKQGLLSEEDIEAHMVYSELLGAIHQEVLKLPEKQKQTFLLTFFEGLSTEEIAQRLNISHNAVFIHKHEALKNIRRIFKKQNSLFYLLFICYFTS